MEERYALLIDADNVSAKYIKPILDELSKYGNVTYKRIYGDWTNSQSNSWKEELLKNSITPIQQFSYTYGKNATDSAMIIDAMDILYTNKVDGFCIVSSDSDFTRLASRIRESGLMVIGMGEEKTPGAFRKACDIFTGLELLIEENSMEKEEAPCTERRNVVEEKVPQKQKGNRNLHSTEKGNDDVVTDKKQIEEAVIKIITENQNRDRETGLGEIGSRLVKLYPDFDVRSYGYSLLSKFLDEFTKIKVVKRGNSISVVLVEDLNMKKAMECYIVDCIREAGRNGMELGALANKVYLQYSNFKVRDYGYSQFKKYVRSIEHIKVVEEEKLLRAIYCGN